MRLTVPAALGFCLVLCSVLARADGAAAAPAGSAIATATQRAVTAGTRHHSSPLKRYRRHRSP